MKGKLLAVVLLGMAAAAAASAAAQAPIDSEAIFNAGLTHLREGRAEMALDSFQRAVKQDPKNPYFRKGLGLAHARLGNYKEAIGAFRKALELNPYYVDVHNDLGSVLILAGQREEGKKEFLAAYNDPTNPTPEVSSRNLGQAYLEEKNLAEALNWFRTSVNRNKNYPDAHLGLADALLALGRAEEAVVQLEAGVAANPEEPSLTLALGQAYYRVGRFTEARARLEEAVKKDPTGPSGRAAAELLKKFPK